MNNEVLNMNRFGRYLVTDIKNAISKFGISLLVMATISLTGYLICGFFSMIVGTGWHSLGIIGRMMLFGISTLVVFLSAPSKIYGFLTDKREGSAYLMIPASSLEKTISMVIVTCIVLPLAFFAIYFSLDQIVCLIDGGCGVSIAMALNSGYTSLADNLSNLPAEMKNIFPESVVNTWPWLYLDDMAQTLLIFLYGALIFKSSKPAKTIGCLILLSIVLSMITTPIIAHGAFDKFKIAVESGMTPDQIVDMFPGYAWMLKHAALVDTITDTVVNVGLFVLILFRVKRIKH